MAVRLPRGWAWVALRDCVSSVESGVSVNGDDEPAIGLAKGVLKVSAVSEGRFLPAENKRIASTDLMRARLNPRAGCLLMSRANTPELVGSVAYVGEDYPTLFLSDKLWQISLPEHGRVSAKWLAAVLASDDYRKQLMELATGSSRSMRNISQEDILALEIPVPPRHEQRRIVAVLDACDAEISLGATLSARARQFYRAVVRELVDRVSAPMVRLGDVIARVARAPESADAIPLTISAALGLIPQTRFFGKRVASRSIDTYTLLRRGEFAYNKSYSDGYPLGATKRLEVVDAGILSSLYLCFGISDEARLDGDYLAIVFDSGWFNKQLQQIAQEGARNHGLLNVSAADFFDMQLPLPAPNVQKEVVVAVKLAATQQELAERHLNAVKRRKRGLMQKLLAGQWRPASDATGDVPNREVAHA